MIIEKLNKKPQIIKESKILMEAEPAPKDGAEVNAMGKAPEEVIQLLALLKDLDVSVINVCDQTIKFVKMPSVVLAPLKELFNLLRSTDESDKLVTAALELGAITEEWYGHWKTSSSYAWDIAGICRKKVQGVPDPLLGNAGQGPLLNRPKEAYDNSSYGQYKTYIDHAHALLKYGFGYGPNCASHGVFEDQINIARCHAITKDQFKLFYDLKTAASTTYSLVSGYADKIRGTSWSNEGAHSQKGPERFKAAIDAITPFLKPYGSSISGALGDPWAHFNNGPKARSVTPTVLKYIDGIIAALKSVDTWISQEISQDAKIAADKEANDAINSKGINWSQSYVNAQEKGPDAVNKFFDQYYENEWGKTWGPIISKIGTPFIQEVQELGFSISNPFIFFLKKLQQLCEDPEHKLDVKDVNLSLGRVYPAIHNAFVNKKLEVADLKGVGVLGINNLIFCPALYGSTGQNIVAKEYLDRQQEIITKHKGGQFSSEKLKAMYSMGSVLFCFTKILFESERSSNIDTGAHDIVEKEDWTDQKCTEIVQTARLRGIAWVDEQIREVFTSADNHGFADEPDKSVKTGGKLDADKVKKLLNKLTPEEKAELKKMIG